MGTIPPSQRMVANYFCRILLHSATCMRCLIYCSLAITLFGLVMNNHYYNNPFRAPHGREHNIYLDRDYSLLARDAKTWTEPEKHDSLQEGAKQQTEPEKHDALLEDTKQQTEPEKHDALLEDTKQQTEPEKHDALQEDTKQQTEPEKHDALLEGVKQQTEPEKHDTLLEGTKQQTEPEKHDALLDGTKQQTEPEKYDALLGAKQQTEPEKHVALLEGVKQQTEPEKHDALLVGAKQQAELGKPDSNFLTDDSKKIEPDAKQGSQHGNYTIPTNTTLLHHEVMSDMQTTTRPTPGQYERVKLVLMWPVPCITLNCTKERAYYLRKGLFDHCIWKSCKITGNTSQLMSSDAVLFLMSKADILGRLREFPTQRNISQHWVFYNRETPFHYPYGGPGTLFHKDYPLYNDVYNGIFNWTMTYRLDSDIPFNYHFAKFVHARHHNRTFNYGANKTKLVAAIISHCCTVSRRENYLEVLNRTVPVHVYGHCLDRPCNGQCFDAIADKYKFFIAFENTVCKDYVTEKFYKTIRANIVPIVMGGANYSHLLPHGSYVDVMDFSSPRDLGKYLLYLDKAHFVYNKMLMRKATVRIPRVQNGYCALCERLHMDKQPKVYEDMYEWWVRKSQCVPKRPSGWMNTSKHGIFPTCYPEQLKQLIREKYKKQS